jgi:hypothetical protein
MSLSVCIAGLVKEGRISKGNAAEAERLYAENYNRLKHTMGESAAASEASERAVRALEAGMRHKHRTMLLDHKAKEEWLAKMRAAAPSEDAPLPAFAAEDAIVEMDGHRKAIRKQALGMMNALLARHRRNVAGVVRAKSELDDVLGELFGRDSGSVNAKEIADAWRQTGEWLRSRFNAAGGRIAKLDTWHLPQRHDMRRVRDAGFAAWRDALVGRPGEANGLLDRAKMIDRDTGLPFADDKLDAMLESMWQAIATDGWTRNNPGAVHGGALANSRADHRVLHFAGPEEWAAYAERFGAGGTMFDTMIGHIEAMSIDIAAMERMGPNPAATLRWQQDWLKKSAAEALAAGYRPEPSMVNKALRSDMGQVPTDRAERGGKQIGRLYDEYSGASNRPENRRLAIGFSVFRAQQTAAKLGGAFLSIGGDFGTMVQTARFNGIPAAKTLNRYRSMMNPRNKEDRALAARLGLIADSWASMSAGQARLSGEEITHEAARRMAEGVLRVSGLVAHTDIAQQAFGMEMLATLAHARGRAFGNLDPALAGLLKRYGIDEARWDALRAVPLREERGVEWLFPEEVAKADQGLGDDLMRMLATEADYAIPVPDLRTRTLINARLPRGDLMGEIGRSLFLFKGFPLTIINLHGRRMLEQGIGRGTATMAGLFIARYGLWLMALTTLGGAISVQLKEIAAGRDPLPMDDATFWTKAGFQGGGLGIFGDLLKSSENRVGGGVGATLAGPGAQFFDNSVLAIWRNSRVAADGDPESETHWAKDAAKFALSETPALSLWYGRLAIDRLFGDLVREWADDDVGAAYRRIEQRARDEGTGYWAPPGGRLPERGPDFGNALGVGDREAAAPM